MINDVQVFADGADLAGAAAQVFIQNAAEAITARGCFNVVLSGGSTPKAMYQLLATHSLAEQIDWGSVQVFWGDERDVPPDHPESNYRMANEALLEHVPIPRKNIHRIFSEEGAQSAAADYEHTLRRIFDGHFPCFDLVYLGMGIDGHTASLFPHTFALDETVLWVVSNYLPQQNIWRVTLTASAINAARKIVFLVSGERKTERLIQVLHGPYQPKLLPSQLVKPKQGELLWMVDHPIKI